ILNQLLDRRDREGMAIVFITHDLSVARYVADRIAVMYLGMFVEVGTADDIIDSPQHPYSQALLSHTLPAGDEDITAEPIEIGGEVPTPVDLKEGCRFASRCPAVFDRFRVETPKRRATTPTKSVACHLYDQ
ncbi:MAG: ABC transporter ATP-binding protein, partial [Thermomicrobiales bacterium]